MDFDTFLTIFLIFFLQILASWSQNTKKYEVLVSSQSDNWVLSSLGLVFASTYGPNPGLGLVNLVSSNTDLQKKVTVLPKNFFVYAELFRPKSMMGSQNCSGHRFRLPCWDG